MVIQTKPAFYERWSCGRDRIAARILQNPMYEYKEKPMSEGDKKEVTLDFLKELSGIIEEVRAIEVLEYHNKNHLAFDTPKRSSHKIALLDKAFNILSFHVKKDNDL